MSALTASEFKRSLDDLIRDELGVLKSEYRKRFIRLTAIGIIVFTAMFFGVRSFFVPLMLLFLFIGYGIYWYFSGKHTRVRKDLSAEARRMMLKAVANLAVDGKGVASVLSHRYLPEGDFLKSTLFRFKPERYQGQELIDLRDPGKIEACRVDASCDEDPFAEQEEFEFKGYMLKIRPSGNRFPEEESTGSDLDQDLRFHYDGDHAWLAYPEKKELVNDYGLSLGPDYVSSYQLYLLLVHARSMADQG